MSNPEELTIIIEDHDNVRALTKAGAEASGSIQLDDMRFRTIELFEDWLAEGRIRKRKELVLLGTLLYEALFSTSAMVTLFENALARAKGTADERLLVRLRFQERAHRLRTLPWEYLYYPDTGTEPGYFFSTVVKLVLSRYMPGGKDDQPDLPAESPLDVLIVVSNPHDDDLGPVSPDEVIQSINDLKDKNHPIKVTMLETPTVDKVLEVLENSTPHVLHFVGYGRRDTDEEDTSEIALLAPDMKSVEWRSDADFAEFFTQTDSYPPLIFLHLWGDSTSGDPNATFDKLAPRLILEGIPRVVALRYPITKKASTAFCKAFYRELAKGETVEYAVQKGRWNIIASDKRAYSNRVFGSPVLYARHSGSIVRKLEAQPSPQEAGQEAGARSRFGAGGRVGQTHVIETATPSTVRETEAPAASLAEEVIAVGQRRIEELNLSREHRDEFEMKFFRIRKEFAASGASEIRAEVTGWLLRTQDENFQRVYWSMIKAIGGDVP